ncbi:MAG: hypothetical protein HN855_14060 [Anaerolineae bacterium]|jgi:hypothetical protein|nr:hypothetical protein [Anaerolineae bacterium]MBT7070653.1 hypothetical protein [Anaerolineae bacterium]MBT7326281.1 hypothetical protein [Anaerolineae bacterium]
MKIISNEKLISRNAKIGQITSLGSLAVLGIGMYIFFTRIDLFNISIAALLAGFIMSQVGIYFGNRWGRSPRPDELIDQGLKGLNNDYTIYHFSTPVPNLLVGPAGVWLLLPYHQQGKVVYDGKKWRTEKGGLAQSYMRIFGQDNMSRPDLDAGAEADKLTRYLKKQMPEEEIPPILAGIIFTSDHAEVQADNAPVATMHLKKLKSYIRKIAKESPITKQEIEAVNKALSAQEITNDK